MNTVPTTRMGFFARVSGWQLAGAAFAVAVAMLLGCYWQTLRSLVWAWGHDGTYQYAFLIFPLSAWVAFTLRDQVRARAPAPSVWGVAAVAVLAGLWYAGHLLTINLVQHFAFVSLFPALVLACWGWRALWVLKFPLAYLVVFAVPWGNGMVEPLQTITAHIAVAALDLTGQQVLMNGHEIVTPIATWMVADACSGVKFFVACTALGCLYGYLMYQKWWKRVLFVVLSAIVPIIANGLRVYFTVLIGEGFGLKYATGTDHMVFGWQFFGTVLVLLLLAGWFFRDRFVVRERPPVNDDKPSGIRTAAWPVALALLIAAPVTAATMMSIEAPQTLSIVAPAIAGWRGPTAASGDWRPSFKGPAGEFKVAYHSVVNGSVVDLYHAVYLGKPRRGHDLITYGNNVYDPVKLRLLSTASPRVKLAGGRSVVAGELRVSGNSGSRLVWYWYCVDWHCNASPALTKLRQGWDVLRGHVPRSSVWALSARVRNDNLERTRSDLLAFAHALPATGTVAHSIGNEQATVGAQP